MPQIILYTSTICSFCQNAKRLLQEKGFAYKEIDLSQDIKKREELSIKHNWRTVPMIFIDNNFIGGFQELVALNMSGELDKKMKSSSQTHT